MHRAMMYLRHLLDQSKTYAPPASGCVVAAPRLVEAIEDVVNLSLLYAYAVVSIIAIMRDTNSMGLPYCR